MNFGKKSEVNFERLNLVMHSGDLIMSNVGWMKSLKEIPQNFDPIESSSDEKVTDYRTLISGVRWKDMKNAQPFEELQMKVKDIIKNKTVVGHGLGSDFRALKLKHPKKMVRDTSICK